MLSLWNKCNKKSCQINIYLSCSDNLFCFEVHNDDVKVNFHSKTKNTYSTIIRYLNTVNFILGSILITYTLLNTLSSILIIINHILCWKNRILIIIIIHWVNYWTSYGRSPSVDSDAQQQKWFPHNVVSKFPFWTIISLLVYETR